MFVRHLQLRLNNFIFWNIEVKWDTLELLIFLLPLGECISFLTAQIWKRPGFVMQTYSYFVLTF